MKNIVFVFVLICTLLFASEVSAGFNPFPDTCQPSVVDGVKAYRCSEGTVLTSEQQAKLERINESIRLNQEKNQQKLESIYETKVQLQESQQIKKATVEAKIQERNKVRVRALYGTLSDRIQTAIDRLDTLIVRMQSRIDILSAEGVDTSDVQAQLDEAEALLDSTNANFQAISQTLEDIISSENPKEAFIVLKEELASIKSNLIEVHDMLVHIIGDIKGLRVGQMEKL